MFNITILEKKNPYACLKSLKKCMFYDSTVDITLDADTASGWLLLSTDGKKVWSDVPHLGIRNTVSSDWGALEALLTCSVKKKETSCMMTTMLQIVLMFDMRIIMVYWQWKWPTGQLPEEDHPTPTQSAAVWLLRLCFGETKLHIWKTLLGGRGRSQHS